MLTTKELQAIKDRLAKAKKIWATISPLPQAFVDMAALVADVEQLQAEVKKLQAIVAANPAMSKSVQKKLAAQVLDAVADERHITPPDQRTF